MKHMDDDIDELVHDLAASEPPPDFADRVLRARERAVAARSRTRRAASLGAAALVGAAACFAVVVSVGGTLDGNALSPDRYPKDTTMLTFNKPFPKTIAAAALGTLAGAAFTVAVQAGELTVANSQGALIVKPGEAATVLDGSEPTRAPRPADVVEHLREENQGLRSALEAARAASTGDVTKLVGENQALRAKLQKTDEELVLLEELRKSQEGEVRPFPSDLAPRFAEQTLQKAFDAALEEAGIEGGVVDIDCKEFPCVVYGQVSARDDMDKLRGAPSLASYVDDSDNTSVWRHTRDKDGKKVEQVFFGIAFAPKGAAPDEALDKRTGWRMQQAGEALVPRGE